MSGTFKSVHASMGEVMFAGMPTSQLLGNRVFFFSHTYIVPKKAGDYGKLEPLPPPPLHSLEWPKPDAWSVLALKHKISADICSSMKFGTACKSVGLSWCCPIHVFVHIFHHLPLHQTTTMFLCKEVEFHLFEALLGEKCGIVEGLHNGDTYRCNIGKNISIRYLRSRTTMYIRFHYERWMLKRGIWIPLQLNEGEILPFDISIQLPSGVTEIVQVSRQWTLSDLREHLVIMGTENVHGSTFKVNSRKVGMLLNFDIRFFCNDCNS